MTRKIQQLEFLLQFWVENIDSLMWEHNKCHETICGSYCSFGSKSQHVATSQKGIDGSIKRRHYYLLNNNKFKNQQHFLYSHDTNCEHSKCDPYTLKVKFILIQKKTKIKKTVKSYKQAMSMPKYVLTNF